MNRNRTWLTGIAMLTVVALLLSACGPELATPTARGETAAPTAVAATAPAATQPAGTAAPTAVAVDVGKLPVDPADYHILGPADAPVTVIEYSDFQ